MVRLADEPVELMAIEMRAYATTGLVGVATVNALIEYGEPMMTKGDDTPRTYRAWMRTRTGHRVFGRPADSAQDAAEALLAKLSK